MTTQARHAALLMNLGTPDAPTTPALRRYLREFLSDPFVVDIPAIPRFLLVNCIIVPFRSPKSAHAYKTIWTENGSPLRHYTQTLTERVKAHVLPENCQVDWAMRYGNPGIEPALRRFQSLGIQRLTLVPLYPQFAQSTVTSTIVEVSRVLKKLGWNPELRTIEPFYSNANYLESTAEQIRPLLSDPEKHVLFSFHGIPERHVLKSSPSCGPCLPKPACERLEHPLCYRGQCYETAHALARKLNIPASRYSVSFQSRLGRTPWIRPFTDHQTEKLLQQGVRKVVVACPSFVSDCLETIEEIGIREKERFLAAGGESFELAPCLNDSTSWARSLAEMIQK